MHIWSLIDSWWVSCMHLLIGDSEILFNAQQWDWFSIFCDNFFTWTEWSVGWWALCWSDVCAKMTHYQILFDHLVQILGDNWTLLIQWLICPQCVDRQDYISTIVDKRMEKMRKEKGEKKKERRKKKKRVWEWEW